jgi:hypothetical protein
MDESMNSVHSISAMDISPASSPMSSIHPIPSNHVILNTFQQQQELISNIIFNSPKINEYQSTNKKLIPDEHDRNPKGVCLFSTTFTNDEDEIKLQNTLDETKQIRQRIPAEAVPSVAEPASPTEKSQPNVPKRPFNQNLFLVPVLIFMTYLIAQYLNTSIVQPRSTNWQNASEYLRKNLIGQDQGLDDFKEAVDNHNNFSIVLIEVNIRFLSKLQNKFVYSNRVQPVPENLI